MRTKDEFSNLGNISIQPSFKALMKWQRERRSKVKDLSFQIPQASDKQVKFLKNNRSETSVTWIGHATVLVQVCGFNIITDPVWANRMGLQKRMAPPGLAIIDLPEIDFVLISHNHYDHLDLKSICHLKGAPKYLVPMGLKGSFLRKGLKNVEEFQWWNKKQSANLELVFVPAQHWSKRTLWDTNKSLWGGWIIKGGRECIYFVGDSGYFRGFKEIGEKYTVSHVLMPVGAYEPEWFMHLQHVSPEKAVQAYVDLKAATFIPIHYEAFRLGDEAPAEALQRLRDEWALRELAETKLRVMDLGETLRV